MKKISLIMFLCMLGTILMVPGCSQKRPNTPDTICNGTWGCSCAYLCETHKALLNCLCTEETCSCDNNCDCFEQDMTFYINNVEPFAYDSDFAFDSTSFQFTELESTLDDLSLSIGYSHIRCNNRSNLYPDKRQGGDVHYTVYSLKNERLYYVFLSFTTATLNSGPHIFKLVEYPSKEFEKYRSWLLPWDYPEEILNNEPPDIYNWHSVYSGFFEPENYPVDEKGELFKLGAITSRETLIEKGSKFLEEMIGVYEGVKYKVYYNERHDIWKLNRYLDGKYCDDIVVLALDGLVVDYFPR